MTKKTLTPTVLAAYPFTERIQESILWKNLEWKAIGDQSHFLSQLDCSRGDWISLMLTSKLQIPPRSPVSKQD